MKNITFVAAVLIICLFPIAFLPTNANIIPQTCRKTPKPALCLSSLSSVSGSVSADVKGLARIMNDFVLRNKTEYVLGQIDELIKRGVRPDSVSTCQQKYYTVNDEKINAVDAGLKQRQPLKAEQALDDIVSLVRGCINGLEHSLIGSPLIAMNSNVIDLANVAKAIVQQLQ